MTDIAPEPDRTRSSQTPDLDRDANQPSLFSLLAGLAAVACLFTPRLNLMLPVMASVGCGATAYAKREPRRVGGLIAAAVAIGLLVFSASDLQAPGWFSARGAKIVSSSWTPDMSFGPRGKIRWHVEVMNVSSRPISTVQVEFVSHDASGALLTSDTTFVDAILPGQTGAGEGYADYYGTEATGGFRISRVDFAK